MAKKKRSDGPIAVGLLALHSQRFFARLLKDPRKAMKRVVAERKLKLSIVDMKKVERLIQNRFRTAGEMNPMTVWKRYHRTGLLEDWMEMWIR